MRVGIIGTAKMGRGFAEALSATHEVTVGSRDPERARTVAAKTGAAGAPPTPRRPRTPTS